MAPQDPQSAALLAHIVSQVESNVQFLVAQNYISQADASTMLSKLPNTNNNAVGAASLATRMKNTVISTPAAPPTPQRAPSMPTPATTFQARALWAYNENNQDPEDLSFSAGDIIEIVDETNADWWTGRVNGKQALFPANYVEPLPPTAGPARMLPPPLPQVSAPQAHSGDSEKPKYKPFGAAFHGTQSTAPPPPGQGTNNVGLQEDPGQEKKKSKYGKFGNTMAHSAAGGVGFGAGAAIGGGLVRAIF